MIKIAITSYNNSKWVEMCLNSLLNQDFKEFQAIFVDDCSTDNSFKIAQEIVGEDSRFVLLQNEENKTKSWNFCNVISDYISDNDILLFLDGDDWLATDDVLSKVNKYFELYDPWVCYGGMVVWDGVKDIVEEPFPQNSIIPQKVLEERMFRRDMWRYSHLKAMRGFLWNSINKNNFISKQDNEYIKGGDDLVIMFDALEKTPSHKIGRFDFLTYVYNASDSQRISDHMAARGVDYEREIRLRDKEEPIKFVTTSFSGGLGNMMFQAAGAATIAHNQRLKLFIDPKNHNLPNQGKNIKTYMDNVFRNFAFSSNLPVEEIYRLDTFKLEYVPIVKENCYVTGEFLGEELMDGDVVRDLFAMPYNIYIYIIEKYPDIEERTSIHVRRGDYLKFPNHHPLVTVDYYNFAMNKINPKKVIVFSDDIDWCKKNIVHGDVVYSDEKDFIEMYMMSICEHNIISNSTFSWWGAWLNNNREKIVVAPKRWFGSAINVDSSKIIPKSWIQN